uniref:Uncharacterized protein n=1 Tax=Thermofilum pendens TaxID=2269 RepID=A0A7C3WSX2_THEPE
MKPGSPRQRSSSLLEEVEEAPLQRVLEKLMSLGLGEEECYSAIAAAGLRVEWRGLDPSRAVVRRVPGRPSPESSAQQPGG